MEPPLTDVAPNPELISIVVPTTAPTEGFTMFIFLLLKALICCQLWGAFHLPFIPPLQRKGTQLMAIEISVLIRKDNK